MIEPISMTDYLAQLMKDKEQLAAFPNVFIHLDRLLDEGLSLFPIFFSQKNPQLVKLKSNENFV